jgi:hypothetical protein
MSVWIDCDGTNLNVAVANNSPFFSGRTPSFFVGALRRCSHPHTAAVPASGSHGFALLHGFAVQ